MGTRRNKTIAVQNPHGLAAPQLQDQLWVRIHRMDAHRKQNGRCAYCREPMTRLQATADHVVPRIKGGATSEENIKAACQPCNKAKSSIDVLLANFRLRLWSRVELAERRILAYVGL
jgi:5-methylcytosine-specific restriction endonuclease McrA